ncbi:MAG: tRNA (N6-isopentenyl adenosine(37)-C2)-methylthiotransferase MiaB [Oscillospiraceae bacterium]
MSDKRTIDKGDIDRELNICRKIRASNDAAGKHPLAMVDTYGCQQNEDDSQRIRGYLSEMGYGFTEDEWEADVIVINTCAVREHAEQRVFGNVGALTHTKRKKPGQIIALCGCMMQQKHMAEKIRKSFRHVDLVFGTHALWRFPEFMEKIFTERGRIFATEDEDGSIAEGIPVKRDGKVKAWLSVMYGCNNFCSYCIVPYVRGRERSRLPEAILSEAKALVAEGYKEITLLGQNVNSYGKDLDSGVDFSALIRMINAIPGEFVIRFMTSHPKDATETLFRTMSECEKCERHIHLPLQAGNNRVLKAMNRGYDAAKYLSLVDMARRFMPDIVLTTDIIVGFPGETDEEFEDTLNIIEQVRFDAMFTFIYSPRPGTPAAEMPDPFTREQKQVRFDRLLEAANRISEEKHTAYLGKTLRVLVDGESGDARYNLTSRTKGGRLVHLAGDSSLIGCFTDVKITETKTWALFGEAL